MTLPDYAGGSIANLMSSIAAGFGSPPGLYNTLGSLGRVGQQHSGHMVLIVIDGLGYNYVQQASGASVLRQHLAGSLTSVFPSTTATAVTTFLTGVPAQQHGLTGWHIYLEEIGESAAILLFETRGASTPLRQRHIDPAKLFDYPTFFENLNAGCHAISPDSIAFSDFNRAHTRGALTLPYRSLTQFFEAIERLTRAQDERRFIYAYYPELDSSAHEHGVASLPVANVCRRVAEGLERLLRSLAGRGVTVIVTADHGFVDAPAAKRVELDAHPYLQECLAQPLCGERRLAYCYVKPDKHQPFETYVANELAHACTAVPSSELVDKHYFGIGEAHPKLPNRTGDYTLLMNAGYTIKDWLPGEKRHNLTGVHGGTTQDEMLVPLVVATP
ncbi:MAG: PglZ domain-containing protein [Betaproteobacteria bacterium]|nr:PglZ domain-containing protein [Betaproteobacteria bacterium]